MQPHCFVCMDFSAWLHVGHITILQWLLIIARCSVVGLGLWLVKMLWAIQFRWLYLGLYSVCWADRIAYGDIDMQCVQAEVKKTKSKYITLKFISYMYTAKYGVHPEQDCSDKFCVPASVLGPYIADTFALLPQKSVLNGLETGSCFVLFRLSDVHKRDGLFGDVRSRLL